MIINIFHIINADETIKPTKKKNTHTHTHSQFHINRFKSSKSAKRKKKKIVFAYQKKGILRFHTKTRIQFVIVVWDRYEPSITAWEIVSLIRMDLTESRVSPSQPIFSPQKISVKKRRNLRLGTGI